jgi:hypothetical protein
MDPDKSARRSRFGSEWRWESNGESNVAGASLAGWPGSRGVEAESSSKPLCTHCSLELKHQSQQSSDARLAVGAKLCYRRGHAGELMLHM